MQVINYTDARDSFKTVIDKVIEDQGPALIHRREGGNAVLLSEQAHSHAASTTSTAWSTKPMNTS